MRRSSLMLIFQNQEQVGRFPGRPKIAAECLDITKHTHLSKIGLCYKSFPSRFHLLINYRDRFKYVKKIAMSQGIESEKHPTGGADSRTYVCEE